MDDDVVECSTVQEEKCEDVTQGYTTEQKCTKWPREVCTKQTKKVLKYSPETDCKKVPRELCGPSGCVLTPGPQECFDKKQTVITEVLFFQINHCMYYVENGNEVVFVVIYLMVTYLSWVNFRFPKRLATSSLRSHANTLRNWYLC